MNQLYTLDELEQLNLQVSRPIKSWDGTESGPAYAYTLDTMIPLNLHKQPDGTELWGLPHPWQFVEYHGYLLIHSTIEGDKNP